MFLNQLAIFAVTTRVFHLHQGNRQDTSRDQRPMKHQTMTKPNEPAPPSRSHEGWFGGLEHTLQPVV